jgi:uncharacterized membrane-anchored protein
MTQQVHLENTDESTCAGRGISRRNGDHVLALVATGLAGLSWVMWHASGTDLAVHAGAGTQHVGLVSALVTAAVVSLAGLGLLRFLEARVDHALRAWTMVACLVWLLSLLGPVGAVSVSAGLGLLSLHLVVGSVVVVGGRSSRRHGVA